MRNLELIKSVALLFSLPIRGWAGKSSVRSSEGRPAELPTSSFRFDVFNCSRRYSSPS